MPCDPKIQRRWPPSARPERQSFAADDEVGKAQYATDEKREKRLRRWAAREDLRRRAFKPGAWVFVVAATATAVGLGLQVANVPDGWWGNRNAKTALDYAVAVAGAAATMLSGLLAFAYAQLRHARLVDRRLEELARSIAREVAVASSLPADHLSVHAWQLRDPRVWLFPRWFPRRPHARHLVRRAAFVPERREHEAIAFMEGMGVVGRCWERRRDIVEDLGDILNFVAANPSAEAYYREFDYDARYRLSFANLWNTRHFWAIWAYPIFLGPPPAKSFGGCVSVDFQCPGHADELRRLADNRTQELDSLLADCGALLRGEAPAV
jgi:hypothetical protein